MNESEPPFPLTPKHAPNPGTKRRVALGFLLGAAAWCSVLIPGNHVFLFLIFDCFALPLIAIILACIPPFRKFGLGLLLASVIGWLVLGAMCGGTFR